MSSFKQDFGSQIKHLRLNHGLTQDELAAKLEMSQSNMCAVERGTRNCSLNFIQKVAEYFRCNLILTTEQSCFISADCFAVVFGGRIFSCGTDSETAWSEAEKILNVRKLELQDLGYRLVAGSVNVSE